MKKLLFIIPLLIISQSFKKKIDVPTKPDTSYKELMWVIKSSEGYSDKTYKCPAGVDTRGWGITKVELKEFNKKNKSNYKWSDLNNLTTNDKLLKEIITWRYNIIKTKYPFLTDRTIKGLTSFTFNCGMSTLNNKGIRQGIKACKKGSTDQLTTAMEQYVYAGKKKLEGLEIRRDLETKLIKNDISEAQLSELQKKVILKITK